MPKSSAVGGRGGRDGANSKRNAGLGMPFLNAPSASSVFVSHGKTESVSSSHFLSRATGREGSHMGGSGEREGRTGRKEIGRKKMRNKPRIVISESDEEEDKGIGSGVESTGLIPQPVEFPGSFAGDNFEGNFSKEQTGAGGLLMKLDKRLCHFDSSNSQVIQCLTLYLHVL